MMTVDQMIEQAHDFAKRVLIGNADAQVKPTFCVQFKSRPPSLISAPWTDDRQKAAAFAAVRQALALFRDDVVSYSFISEVWLAEEDMRHPTGLEPRDREDRKECVFVNAFDRNGGETRMWEINRDANGVVSELVPMAGDLQHFHGRMHNLLEDLPNAQN